MSRIGRQPIELTPEVTVEITGKHVKVTGPKGVLEHMIHPDVAVAQEGSTLVFSVGRPEEGKVKALWGLERSLVANMVEGVVKGYTKQLEIQGIGFRAEMIGTGLRLLVGFTHPVDFEIPEGIKVIVEKNIITVSGIDKELVGSVAARIRSIKPPEPYKGKGIRYVGEVVRKKVGKAAAGSTGAK
ncbi:MAG: 50S ribosomal protein L6 [bacterium]|nr:50S ribosomal protein L6 [bacterium]